MITIQPLKNVCYLSANLSSKHIRYIQNNTRNFSTRISNKDLLLLKPRNFTFVDPQIRTFFRKVRRPRTTAEKNRTTVLYLSSAVIATVGASYAAVPLYKVFCQSTGYGGTVAEGHDTEKVATMEKNEDRLLTIKFNADTAAQMRWNFRPQQPVVHVYAGETALAFYTARNPTEKPIDGISTYNVIPFEAGPYFNKIQCFCFEEQRLNPGEEVDMPVFFYIDPDYLEDPFLKDCNEITLSYTFFKSKPGMKLPTYNPGVKN